MPPYKAAVSKAQERKLFSLAAEGKISKADAIGKARAAKGHHIPERVSSPIREHMRSTGQHPHSNLGRFLHPKKSR